MSTTVVVLGAPDVHDASGPKMLGTRLSRLLAILAANGERHVRAAALVERVWPDNTPGSGEAALRVQVTRLRRHLGSHHSILTMPGRGYRLNVDPSSGVELDSDRFRSLCDLADANRATGRLSEAAHLYRSGLGLWQGAAYDGCEDDPDVRIEQAVLEIERKQARRQLAEVLLQAAPRHSQQHERCVVEVQQLMADQPGDEELAATLMRSLEQYGRASDALRIYREVEAHLRTELGVGPSLNLRALANRLVVDASQPIPA
jgi:DNA-binding SARP family transcriptional activator